MSARTIVVDGQEYRWHRRRRDGDEQLNVWLAEHRQGLLLLRFADPRDADGDYIGDTFFEESIVRWSDGFVRSGVRFYNLNRPAMVAGLIRSAKAHGWSPLGRRPLTLDGFELLREHYTELTHEPSGEPWFELATQLLEHGAAVEGQPPLAWLWARTRTPWLELPWQPPQRVAVTLAVALQFDLWLERRDALTAAQLAEIAVWADARQHRNQPGGLALASWLTRGSISGDAELDDLRWWCETLLSSPSPP